MNCIKITFFVYFACLYVIFVVGKKNQSVFVPTEEWQTVKKGTPLGKGLHIRHNFTSGVTEAKLMDPDKKEDKSSSESQTKSLMVHPDVPLQHEPLEPPLQSRDVLVKDLKEHIRAAKQLNHWLKYVKYAEEKLQNDSEDKTMETVDEKKTFRSYEAIKKDLKDIKIHVATDTELLQAYFQKFQLHRDNVISGSMTVTEVEDILDILNNLEFLIHQIDNAQMFSKMEGMNRIISPCLNGTNSKVKAEALRLLGAAVQSNPKVQHKALKNDILKKLLHILSTNKEVDVRSRCLFALSALTRQFPTAQKALVDHGGLEIFGNILSNDDLQIQIKVMRLINDLTKERDDLQFRGRTMEEMKTRELQKIAYALTGFTENLHVQKYCKKLSNLMLKSCKDDPTNELSLENLQFLKVIYESMIAIYPSCKNDFTEDKSLLLLAVNNMLNFYENSDSNFSSIQNDTLEHLVILVRALRATISENPHDEL